jgi:hypothetical protein
VRPAAPTAAVRDAVEFAFSKLEIPMSVQDRIREQVTGNRIVLYMKGTPQFPQCGFSATVAEILKRCGVTDYKSVDVLQDPEIRQGSRSMRAGRRFRSFTSTANSSAAATS